MCGSYPPQRQTAAAVTRGQQKGAGLVSVFSELRDSLVADLPLLSVSPAWPDTLSPPCGFIAPPLSEAWAVPGPNFGGEFTVSLDLVLLVAHDDAAASLAELEDMVAYALTYTADWVVTGVEAPAPTSVTEGGAEYLASVIHLSKPVQIGV